MKANSWFLCLAVFTSQSFSVSSAELEVAQRYFRARRQRAESVQMALRPHILFAGHGHRLAAKGSSWKARVRLTRVDGRKSARPDLEVDYRVLDREVGPLIRWVVSISSSAWPAGLAWEQMIYEDAGAGPAGLSVKVRPCQSSRCEDWRELSSDRAVPTGGRIAPDGIQAPLFLVQESLSAFEEGRNEWGSEDFFGREQGWSWPSSLPWPGQLWNAQGEVTLLEVSNG